MKPDEIRGLSDDELTAKAQELRVEFFNAKLRKATGQLEDTAKLKMLRRDIARVETILTERRGATK